MVCLRPVVAHVKTVRSNWLKRMSNPGKQVLRWAASAIAPSARVASATGMRAGGNPWLLRLTDAGNTSEVVLKTGDMTADLERRQLRTTVAALELAAGHALTAPRLIAADLDGSAAGTLAVLMTVLPGSSEVPRVASPARLRALGAAAGALRHVALAPRPGLELRTRSLHDIDFAAWRSSVGTSPLLARAEERIATLPAPDGELVLVHGDLWQGNTLWTGDSFNGMIDWDAAGAGSPGIDLGVLRLDAALFFGSSPLASSGFTAADEVLTGWQQAAGRPAEHVAYWDMAAALCTVGDMAYCLPSEMLRDVGRPDLDAAILTARRDAFLAAALDQLDHPD
jgi:aminoglycoside phosphotransferase (APT) family kinase protein